MNARQQRRAEVLGRLAVEGITSEQASVLLGVSERQVRRLLGQFREEGLSSVVHGNSGRSPANKTPAHVRDELRSLAGKDGRYPDFNVCHLQELLAEREGIQIGRSTLDRLLKEAGVRKRKRGRPPRAFGRRERMGRAGELELIDASPHDWLEGRDPRYRKMALIGAVDDATGDIQHLRFWPTECLAGYITLARELTLTVGVPVRFYHDRHTILCSPKQPTIEEELAGREPRSQFEQVLFLLGAEPVRALTPQAKGRIERMWQTLQDRLIKEMRLAGINTLEEANAFLPAFIERYNARFGVKPRDPEPAWVMPDGELDLGYYFAAREERMVRADHTLSFMGRTLQIIRERGEPSLAGQRVMVHTTPEGERFLYLGKRRLKYREVKQCAERSASGHVSARTKLHAVGSLKPEPTAEERKHRYEGHKRCWAWKHAGLHT